MPASIFCVYLVIIKLIINMQVVKNLVAVVGEYTNNAGETKKRYQTVGKMFKRDDGNFTIKLDCLPISNEWTGWVSLFDIDDENKSSGQAAPAGKAKKSEPSDDDLPF